jgi:lipopolysaccharide biosynthesis glycosyltransferase
MDVLEKDRAIVFATDTGFLLPTLVAACQAVAQRTVSQVADVLVVLVSVDKEVAEVIFQEFSSKGLRFIELTPPRHEGEAGVCFNKTHVTWSTLARLMLGDVIPASYQNIVYMDGDIQILGDIAPLVNHTVRPGFIAAANDADFIYHSASEKGSSQMEKYPFCIGVADPNDYFNAGVLAFRLDTWRDMAPRALDYFYRHSRNCLYHDQSALNHVFFQKREVISPIYNYCTDFALLDVIPRRELRIAHFTRADKPWNFAGPPWNGEFLAAYQTFRDEHPVLRPFFSMPSKGELRASALAFQKARLKSFLRTPWRHWRHRGRLQRHIRETAFVV